MGIWLSAIVPKMVQVSSETFLLLSLQYILCTFSLQTGRTNDGYAERRLTSAEKRTFSVRPSLRQKL